MDISDVFSNWLFFIPGLLLYFVPTIAATIRRSKQAFAIFLLNFLLGFTFIGWAIALVWAFASEKHVDAPPVHSAMPSGAKLRSFAKGYGSQQF